MADLTSACDAVLQQAIDDGVPGVVAMATDRDGNVYEGTAGVRRRGDEQEMTTDTVLSIFSTTKAITGTTALQLVERGELDLDAPAREYAPEIGELQVLDGFEEDGEPRLRPPASDPTTRQLLCHTAGLGYDFFNESYARLAREKGQPSIVTATRESLRTPLLFDPGTQWEYGSNIDWVGQVVEGITGKRLGEVMQERVLEPLGMDSTAFSLTDEMRSRMATMHQKKGEGDFEPSSAELPADPEVHMGGHGLWSTAEDYMKFIRAWLRDGEGILEPGTVAMAEQNHLPAGMTIKGLPGVIPALSNDAEFFPGMPKTWALTFMINDEDADTGRPAGSLAWAGLANLYYWIDRRNGLGGFWGTQILPFAEVPSVSGYLRFEKAVYDHR